MKYVINGYKNDEIYRQIFVVVQETKDTLTLKDEINGGQLEVDEDGKYSFIEITGEQYHFLKSKLVGHLTMGIFKQAIYDSYAAEVIETAMKTVKAE
ncbi:hypothetical protein D3C71_1184890 [compost metagenome]